MAWFLDRPCNWHWSYLPHSSGFHNQGRYTKADISSLSSDSSGQYLAEANALFLLQQLSGAFSIALLCPVSFNV